MNTEDLEALKKIQKMMRRRLRVDQILSALMLTAVVVNLLYDFTGPAAIFCFAAAYLLIQCAFRVQRMNKLQDLLTPPAA